MEVTGWILVYAFGDRKGSSKDVIARYQYRIVAFVRAYYV